MRFVRLIGCLSLSAWAVVATAKLRNWNRKFVGFPPIYGNRILRGSSRDVVQRRSSAARAHEVLEVIGRQFGTSNSPIGPLNSPIGPLRR